MKNPNNALIFKEKMLIYYSNHFPDSPVFLKHHDIWVNCFSHNGVILQIVFFYSRRHLKLAQSPVGMQL